MKTTRTIMAILAAATVTLVAATATAQPAYRYGAWSRWVRVEGAEYRYRWGSDRSQSRYATQVDAIFEIRNRQPRAWEGAARSLDCAADTLSRGQRVTVAVNAVRTVTFLTPNCGTRAEPYFRPNVVRSVRID